MRNEEKHPHEKVHVRVITTSGSYPKEGFEAVPATEVVQEILKRAAHKLKLTDTSGWIAMVEGREINSASTYAQNNLRGHVKIDFGPREGGGGYASGSVAPHI